MVDLGVNAVLKDEKSQAEATVRCSIVWFTFDPFLLSLILFIFVGIKRKIEEPYVNDLMFCAHVLVTKDNQRWVQEDKELLF